MEAKKEQIIASGPVIIENGKVLLNREQKDYGISEWFFPGGQVEDGEDLRQACKREVREELGIEIEIIKQLKTIELKHSGKSVRLVHFLAKRIGEIKPAENIAEWAWHETNDLPDNCAPNVYEILKHV